MDLQAIIHIVGFLMCGIALGAMLFFAGVVAPLVFRSLPAEIAGNFIRRLFPVYYVVLMAVTGIAALGLWGTWEALVLVAVCGLFAFARWRLMPKINRARDLQLLGDGDKGRTFNHLHRLSVVINMVQMLALLAIFIRLAASA